MTKQTQEELIKEYAEKMNELTWGGDREADHIHADALLVDLLDKLGYWEVTFQYNQVSKWYS
jgi:hypothetical protein